MTKFKIGRFTYREITEEQYCKFFDEKRTDIYSLIDYDGEPIKYLLRIK